MYQNLVTLSAETDKKLCFNIVNSWAFAAQVPFVAVAEDEAVALADEYVLAFSKDAAAAPICLIGTDGGNRYVNADGSWAAKRIPAQLRSFPFATMAGKAADQVVLLRDAGAPHFSETQGSPLFAQDGSPTQLMRSVETFLSQTHLGMLKAKLLGRQLAQAGVLSEVRLDVELENGTRHGLSDLKIVNKDKLAKLKADVRDALAASGALALAEAQLRSLANVGKLFPAVEADTKKRASKKAAAEAAEPAELPAAGKKPRAARKASAQ